MPIPKTKNVGTIIKFLKREKPTMPYKQKLAIALETARKAGAKIKKKREAMGEIIKKRAKK